MKPSGFLNLSLPSKFYSVLFLALLSLFTTLLPIAKAQSRRGAFVYTGNNGLSGTTNQQIHGYVINQTTGTLGAATGTPFAAGSQVLAIAAHPSGKFAYVATANGTVAAFTVDSYAGTLTPVPGSPFASSAGTGGVTLLTIDPAGKYLYEARGYQLYAFSIDSGSGALSAVAGSPYSTVGAVAVAVDPSDRYLVASNGSGAWVYALDGSTGSLTAVNSTVSGCGGTAMTFEPSGHFLYGNGSGLGISVCSFSSTSGGLMPVSGSPFGSGIYFSGLAAHPSGAFLYASDLNCVNNGPSNWLYGYVIDPSTGALTAIGGSPFALPGGGGCYYDEDVATEASGSFVYTVDANYGTAAYKVNQSTGALTLASNSFSSPGAETLTTVPNTISSTATLTSLSIVPGSAQIATSTLGKQYQFTLQGTFSDGSTGFLTGSATWTSSQTSVATVSVGLATSTGYGETIITATINGISTTATLNVTTPALNSITIAPSSVTVYQGTALQLKATGQYADGSTVDVTNTATWSSSDNTIATVSAQGLVQSIKSGTVTVSVKLQTVTGSGSVTAVTPFAWKTPDPITYGTPLGSTQLNATSGASGTYVYNPPAGTILSAGTQPLNVVFTPDSSYNSSLSATRTAMQSRTRLLKQYTANAVSPFSTLGATATVNLVVNPAMPTVTLSCPEVMYDGKPHSCSGSAKGLSGANVSGVWNLNPASATNVGSYSISGTFTSSDSNYTNGTASATLKIDVATPVITWTVPSTIMYGTALSATQQNAAANVPGTFTYSPVAGTVLTAGTHTLSTTFTPTDAADYTTASDTISIVVAQATPVITWATPASISYGTALSAVQLNATASVPGTFTYSPAAGAVPPVGNDTLTVTFTPTDSVDYTSATATVTLVVTNPANPVPVVGSLSPAYVSQGGTAFTLAVTGVGFTTNSTVYWGATALTTQYVSATQVKAQVPAADIATAGLTAVTVQTPSPGGGTSNSLQFEVDSASSGTTPPSFTTLTATVAASATATYPVTLPSSATNVTVMCLNLPTGATCSYSPSTNAVTIATSAATPAGTYQITLVFTETLPGASTALIFLPIALLPLLFVRRRLTSRGMWITVFLGLIFAGGVVAATGCGGGSSASPAPPNPTHQVTSSGTVSLTVQ